MEKMLFCSIHGHALHHIFSSNHNACTYCIEDMMEAEKKNAAIIAARVRNSISREDYNKALPSIQRAMRALKTDEEDIGILGLASVLAVSNKTTLWEALDDIKMRQSF